MAFTNSSLVSYTQISPNRNSPRNQAITSIVVHHMAGIMSVEQFGALVANPARQMSANYAIGSDGRIGMYCPESDRSWCSSSGAVDHHSITIEVSNDMYGEPWSISAKVYQSLIKLCVDICKRNGIKKLEYKGDLTGTLLRHCDIIPTQCLPIDSTELLTPNGWKLLSDIKIGDIVATVHIDTLGIKFDTVLDVVPVKTQDTYILRDFEATSDHRIMYYIDNGRQYVTQFKDVYDSTNQKYFANAGHIVGNTGFGDISLDELEFLIAVQADGHYMYDGDCKYGVEFHLTKERKIERLTALFTTLGYEYSRCNQSDGTVKLRLYGRKYYDFCETYLKNKAFTWDWLNMSDEQAEYFLSVILLYDGCEANNSYSSYIPQNVDIVQAIASLHNVGSKLTEEHNRVYFKKNKRSFVGANKKRNKQQRVSCVTVPSGFILIRQHGRTTITGNCPGTWIKNHTQELCDNVNAQLNTKPTPKTLYTKTLVSGTPIYKEDSLGKGAISTITVTTKYSIIEEKVVNYVKYGKLKSGAGWVEVEKLKRTFDINKATDVKELQTALNAHGFNCGTADGVIGKNTTNAMFQALCEEWLQYK